jgi:hypothetical protein
VFLQASLSCGARCTRLCTHCTPTHARTATAHVPVAQLHTVCAYTHKHNAIPAIQYRQCSAVCCRQFTLCQFSAAGYELYSQGAAVVCYLETGCTAAHLLTRTHDQPADQRAHCAILHAYAIDDSHMLRSTLATQMTTQSAVHTLLCTGLQTALTIDCNHSSNCCCKAWLQMNYLPPIPCSLYTVSPLDDARWQAATWQPKQQYMYVILLYYNIIIYNIIIYYYIYNQQA